MTTESEAWQEGLRWLSKAGIKDPHQADIIAMACVCIKQAGYEKGKSEAQVRPTAAEPVRP
jgi:hypothetical protein